jgi:ribosomal protein L11 methyltransferase
MTWLEVSLTVDGEMAEAVAEVLARYIPDGVVIESTAVAAEADDEGGHAVGPLRALLPMDANLEQTRRRIEEGLWYLGRIRTLPAPLFKPFEEINWVEAWKEHYHPIPVGERLIIVPASSRSTGWAHPHPHRLGWLGTGTHPNTQLCLEFGSFDAYPPQGYQVLDITQVRILAVAPAGASRLGDINCWRWMPQENALNGLASGCLARPVAEV